MRTSSLLPIHIILDTASQNRYSYFELAKMAIAGGANVIQYRNKLFDDCRDIEELKAISAIAKESNTALIINDFVYLAQFVQADGVHLGNEDLNVYLAREILGEKAIIGATVHTIDELNKIKTAKVNYIGVGPLYGTTSKKVDVTELDKYLFERICRVSNFPVVAIGGINEYNIEKTMEYGAKGVAILSAFCCHENPLLALERIKEKIK